MRAIAQRGARRLTGAEPRCSMRSMLPQDQFLLIGHRGASGLAPENTLASFAKAVALGADGVELDVRLADGEIVVIHDERVDRTTNGSGQVSEMSFAALRGLNAGDGEQIPTLAEVLAALPRDVAINVELKGAGTAEPVAAMLADQQRPLLVSSFDHGALAQFHAALPKHSLRTVAAPMASGCASRCATPRCLGRQHRRSDRDACAHSHDSQLGLPLSRLYRRRCRARSATRSVGGEWRVHGLS